MMRPHHHDPEECEKDCIEDCACSAEVLLSVSQVETLVPNAKIQRQEVLPHKQHVHEHHREDALGVLHAAARITTSFNFTLHGIEEA